MQPLVRDRSQFPEALLIHVGTTMSGTDPYQSYLDGHLRQARYLSLDDDLADPAAPVRGRHPLPTAERFAASLARIGIGVNDTVLAYDRRGGAFASRLVWMLRVIGQDAALLEVSEADPGPFEPGEVEVVSVERRPVGWPPSAVADADAVAHHLAAGGIVVDSREAPRYRGEIEPIDAVAGHIPGAINLPFAENLDAGAFHPIEQLSARFAQLAGDPEAIVYCGSGVTACHNALAAEAAGLPLPRVYVGSWSGWSTDPGRPIATVQSGR